MTVFQSPSVRTLRAVFTNKNQFSQESLPLEFYPSKQVSEIPALRRQVTQRLYQGNSGYVKGGSKRSVWSGKPLFEECREMKSILVVETVSRICFHINISRAGIPVHTRGRTSFFLLIFLVSLPFLHSTQTDGYRPGHGVLVRSDVILVSQQMMRLATL